MCSLNKEPPNEAVSDVVHPHALTTTSEYSLVHYGENLRGFHVPVEKAVPKLSSFCQRNQSFQRACFLDSVLDLRFGVDVNTSLE